MIVEGVGSDVGQLLSAKLLSLLFRATRHPNRFVRETSYHTLACICSHARGQTLQSFGRELATCLQDGLSENWSQVPGLPRYADIHQGACIMRGTTSAKLFRLSHELSSLMASNLCLGLQVRYAACICARAMLQAADGFQSEYLPLILPHLCFNRYDVAEGVRFYSLETWKLVLKSDGPSQVAGHIAEVGFLWPLNDDDPPRSAGSLPTESPAGRSRTTPCIKFGLLQALPEAEPHLKARVQVLPVLGWHPAGRS